MKTYVIQSSCGLIKIGKSLDPSARLNDLQVGSPHELTLLGVIDDDVESDLHMKFADLRRRGEWFEPDKDLIKWFNSDNRIAKIVTPTKQQNQKHVEGQTIERYDMTAAIKYRLPIEHIIELENYDKISSLEVAYTICDELKNRGVVEGEYYSEDDDEYDDLDGNLSELGHAIWQFLDLHPWTHIAITKSGCVVFIGWYPQHTGRFYVIRDWVSHLFDVFDDCCGTVEIGFLINNDELRLLGAYELWK